MWVIEFVRHYPLIAIAIWFALANLVFGWFEQRHNLRTEHL